MVSGLAQAAGLTLHIENLYGENNHHIVESAYKALARALRQAVTMDSSGGGHGALNKRHALGSGLRFGHQL